jgi:hypothetical protein
MLARRVRRVRLDPKVFKVSKVFRVLLVRQDPKVLQVPQVHKERQDRKV